MNLTKNAIEMIRKHLERRLSFPISHIELLNKTSNHLLVRNSINGGYENIGLFDFGKVEKSEEYSDMIKIIVDRIREEYDKGDAVKSKRERQEIEARQIHIMDYPARISEKEPTEEQKVSIKSIGDELSQLMEEYKAKAPTPIKTKDQELIDKLMHDFRRDTTHNMDNFTFEIKDTIFVVRHNVTGESKCFRFKLGLSTMQYYTIVLKIKGCMKMKNLEISPESDEELIDRLVNDLNRDGYDTHKFNIVINGKSIAIQDIKSGRSRMFKFRLGSSPSSSRISYEGIYNRVKDRVIQLTRIKETRNLRETVLTNEELIKKLKRQLRVDYGKFLSQYVISVRNNFMCIENTRTGGRQSFIYKLLSEDNPMAYDRLYDCIKIRYEKLDKEEKYASLGLKIDAELKPNNNGRIYPSFEKMMANSSYGIGLGEISHFMAPFGIGKSKAYNSYMDCMKYMRESYLDNTYNNLMVGESMHYKSSVMVEFPNQKQQNSIISEVKEIEI